MSNYEGLALVAPSDKPLALEPARKMLSLDELRQMGAVFYASGMFKDLKSEAQAIVKIVAGQELGIGPMSAMTQIQIVDGKPTLTAPAVGGRIKASGRYDYRITEHTTDACHIVFYDRGEQIGESRFTMDDARAAQLTSKDVWRKYPRNMLFARAITNGARWYCADIFNGAIYTPEELDAIPAAQPIETTTHTALPSSVPSVVRVKNDELVRLHETAGKPGGTLGKWLVATLGGYTAGAPLTAEMSVDAAERLRALADDEPAHDVTEPDGIAPFGSSPSLPAEAVTSRDSESKMTEAQRKRWMAMAKEAGYTEKDRHFIGEKLVGKASSSAWTIVEAGKVMDYVEHLMKGEGK